MRDLNSQTYLNVFSDSSQISKGISNKFPSHQRHDLQSPFPLHGEFAALSTNLQTAKLSCTFHLSAVLRLSDIYFVPVVANKLSIGSLDCNSSFNSAFRFVVALKCLLRIFGRTATSGGCECSLSDYVKKFSIQSEQRMEFHFPRWRILLGMLPFFPLFLPQEGLVIEDNPYFC